MLVALGGILAVAAAFPAYQARPAHWPFSAALGFICMASACCLAFSTSVNDYLCRKRPPVRQRFSLSKSNKICFVCIALLHVGLFAAMAEKTAYQIGAVFAILIGLFLIPLLLSWGVWRLPVHHGHQRLHAGDLERLGL